MIPPFDIKEMRANIGDDPETESMLLGMFVQSAGESLRLLSDNFPLDSDADYNALWKTHMHQIKGAALNIGAAKLYEVSRVAQDEYEAPPEDKKIMLDNVTAQFQEVENYIQLLLAAKKPLTNQSANHA